MSCNCNDMNIGDNNCVNNNCGNNNCGNGNSANCSRFFPQTIEDALRRLVCDTVVLTYVNGNKERVRIECVTDELVVVKEQNCFRFISIDCICSIAASSETILNGLLGNCD